MSEERCLRCSALLFDAKRYEGYCSTCYSYKKDFDTINQLQARVKELEAKNQELQAFVLKHFEEEH